MSAGERMELVTVFATGDLIQLALAKVALESAGIPFMTQGEGVQRLFGGMKLLTGPVRIQVRSPDADRAREALADVGDS